MAKKLRAKKRIARLLCALLALILALPSAGTVIAYERIFGMRYEPEAWQRFYPEEFPDLQVERSDFNSDGTTLAGFKYSSSRAEKAKGVVVMAHGMGSGGHNTFMPLIAAFTSGGYCVFAYDACGNGDSGGDSVEGLPQGLIDLDNAISHAEALPEYAGLPFMLFGHSWGAYASANALAFHPEIEAAVIVSGFNESEDMLRYFGDRYAGLISGLLLPYLEVYEAIKFGRAYTEISAVEAMAETDARIMIVHSADDATVPVKYGYNVFYEAFEASERFDFVLYEDRGHARPFDCDEARAYMTEMEDAWSEYAKANEISNNRENRAAYFSERLDKTLSFKPDQELMNRILALYDASAA